MLSFLINCARNLGTKGLDENASKILIPHPKDDKCRNKKMGYIDGTLENAGKQYDMPYTRNDLAPVVQKSDGAIHRINHYSLDSE